MFIRVDISVKVLYISSHGSGWFLTGSSISYHGQWRIQDFVMKGVKSQAGGGTTPS